MQVIVPVPVPDKGPTDHARHCEGCEPTAPSEYVMGGSLAAAGTVLMLACAAWVLACALGEWRRS